ncbi:MAG: VWA domain-containing protein [Armatimonadetes bacterium]|nr:VWA domain-containing protein [Armatimonadota bacterium]
MRFANPEYLLLIPVAVAFVLMSGRRYLGVNRLRKRIAMAFRLIVATLLIFAIAGWQSVGQNKGVCTIFLLDMSDSVPEDARRQAEEYISQAAKHLGDNDKIGIVAFGEEPLVDTTPANVRQVGRLLSAPGKQGTDIAAAARLAMALFPDGHGRRIALLSDGNETNGDAAASSLTAAAEQVEIDTIQLASAKPKKDALIAEAIAPSEVKIGEPFNLRVNVDSSDQTTGILRVDLDGRTISEAKVSLSPGKNNLIVPIQTERPGFFRYRATLEIDSDGDPRNNVGRAFVAVRGKPTVLVASGTNSNALVSSLRQHDIDVESAPLGAFPSRPTDLQRYDLVVLNDYPADGLSAAQMLMLQAAVRDSGTGFAMIGGERSFLSGGYYETPIAEMLPVDLNVRQRKTFPAATVVIAIDISGSMAMVEGGYQKVQLAGHAAMQTLKLLRPDDRFGVIVSGTGVDWLTPIQEAAKRQEAMDKISRIYAGGGGIYVRPSLEYAYRALTAEKTRTRHLIVLADGNDADEQQGCIPLAASLASRGVTLSVVSLGQGKDAPFLQQLAAAGKGNFFLAQRASDLPKLFTADVALMTRSAIEEGAFLPKVTSDELLRGIDWSSAPPLLAYNLVSDRPLARTLMRTHKDDPLFAIWRYGLGSSIAFASDSGPRWAQRWLGWNGYGAFWSQTLRGALRQRGKTDHTILVRREGSRAIVEMQAFDALGNPINFLSPNVRASRPDGSSLDLKLNQTAPGKYEAEMEAKQIGDYLLTYVEQSSAGEPLTTTTAFAVPYPPEYRFARPDEPLMRRIAELSGGRANPRPEELFRPVRQTGTSVKDLWPLCLWLATGLFLIDVAIRRVGLPVALFREAAQAIRARLRRQPRIRTEPVGTTGKLLTVKSRTTKTEPPPQIKVETPSKSPVPPPPEPSGDTMSELLKKKRERKGS